MALRVDRLMLWLHFCVTLIDTALGTAVVLVTFFRVTHPMDVAYMFLCNSHPPKK